MADASAPPMMTRPELRIALDWFCGCGDPAGAAKAVLDILEMHPLYESWGEFKEMVPGDESVRYVLLYALDTVTSATRFDIKREGWFEHGSSIGGQWLTPEGERVRDALRREYDLGPDTDGDHFAALFDEPPCVHGYALGDPGYEEHDCMVEEKPTTVYTFPVCVPCGTEIDESNEHKHQGDEHDIQRLDLAPVGQHNAVDALVADALKLADVHDETVDGEWGSGHGEALTEEAEAVRAAVAEIRKHGSPE